MRIISGLFGLVLGALFAFSATAQPLEGPVLITVSGNITNPNRGPVDEFHDAFFISQDVEFEKAKAFDLSSLKALGFHTVTATYEDWPGKLEFEGPLLKDVLDTAGAEGKVIAVKALDGYAPEIEMQDVEKYPVILALKVNGKYLGLGGRGPAWVVYPRDDFDVLKEEDDSKYVWSTYLIEVKQ